MSKRKSLKQILAIILILTVLTTEMPLEVLGMERDEFDFLQNSEISMEETVKDVEEAKKPHIIAEMDSERSETTKTFRMSDGSYTLVTYDQPVHYENEEGDYEEIDNTMISDEAEMFNSSAEKVYKNRAGKTDIMFKENSLKRAGKATNTEDENMQSVDEEAFSSGSEENLAIHEIFMDVEGEIVSWSYEGISEGEIEWEVEEDSELSDDEKFLTVSKAISRGIYEDAFAHTDFQYIISPEGIKENIILKDRKANNIWKLNMNIGALKAIQKDEQTIELYGEMEEPVMIISAPMMIDAEGKINAGVTMELEEKENRITLTITTSKEFLQNEETVYPVTIDPYFYLVSKSDVNISDTFVSSAKPSTNMRINGVASGSLVVGREASAYGKTRSLLKMDKLPKLPAGSVIVGADLILLNYYSYSANKSMIVDVRRATANWSQKTATWNNSNNIYENEVQDYYIVPQNENPINKFDTWEITRLVKGWYEGTIPNYGVMLTSFAAENASPANCTKYLSSNSLTYGGLYPTFLIAFRSNIGLENYWTYHEQSVDGGNGYINDYSGNVVFTVPIASTYGANLPTEINFVYNSCTSNQQYMNNKKGSINGAGWKTTYGQRLDKVEEVEAFKDIASKLKEQGFDYVWLDGDGTYHFFKKQSNGVYKDEDGLELTMKPGQTYSSYKVNVIEDKSGNKTGFLTNGYLLYMSNHLNQTIQVSYNGANINRIIDGAGRKLTFEYASSTITSITGPDGIVKFAYEGANLIRIDFPDGTKVHFGYTPVKIEGTTYNLLTSVIGKDGIKIVYAYYSLGTAQQRCRVERVSECAADGMLGNVLELNYSKQNTTEFTYVKSSGKVTETYQFNNWGHTTGILSEDGNIAEVQYNTFDGSTGNATQLATNYKITKVGAGTKYIHNMLLNHSAEDGTSNWSASQWAATNAKFSIDKTESYLGYQSLKVSQDYSNPQRCGWRQSVKVTGGKTYTVSAYVKTKDVIKREKNGATLYAVAYSNSAELKTLECDTQLTGDNDWKRLSITFTAPAEALRVDVYGGLRYANGTAWFDCFQVEENDTVSSYNLIENSDMNSDGKWKGNSLTSGDGVTGGVIKISGSPKVLKNMYQSTNINKPGTAFHMRASAKAAAVPQNGKGECYFAIDIGIWYTDGTRDWTVASFNLDTSDWQNVSVTAAPKKENAKKNIAYVWACVLYYNQSNTAYFDNVMLTIDETGTTYSYDSKGNLISSADNAKQQTTYTINNATDMITSLKDTTNTVYSYTYDTTYKKQLKSAKEDSTGIGFEYTYGTANNRGNVERVRTGKVGSMTAQKYIESNTEYTDNGAFVKAESDQRGNQTSYDVDSETGQVNSLTDPLNHKIDYVYDGMTHNLIGVNSGDASLSYNYDTAALAYRLKSIQANDTTYNFFYDKWANVQSINVGETQTLLINDYEDKNGNIKRQTYGNGQSIEYVYDQYDRLIAEKASNDGKALKQTVTYTYNSEGKIARIQDLKNNDVITYDYDISGRMTGYLNKEGRITYGYDNFDRTEKVTVDFDDKKFTTNYSYLSANRPGATMLPEGKSDRVYDSLQRESVHQVYPNKNANKHLRSEVTFLELGNNRTTEWVEGYDNFVGTSGEDKQHVNGYTSFEYAYDKNGNITKVIEKDGVKKREKTYEYDNLNQLVRENDEAQKKTIIYAYDNAGNLLRKIEYSYTTGKPEKVLKTIEYNYEDPIWKDKMTAYEGQAVTYDGMGNPLSYRDKMQFSWQDGTQLAEVQLKDGTSISYKYNTDGVRIGKTVGSIETSYLVDSSGEMQAMKQGKESLVFMYDAMGRREGFIWYTQDEKQGVYYYLYNMQGDVIGIVASDMTPVVTYEYNSWGKLLNTNGKEADTVGKLNPFRYRGYIYEEESGLYYIASRYYDPETCRFINADDIELLTTTPTSLTDKNLYAYCDNNPVVRVDADGEIWTVVAGVGINLVTSYVAAKVTGQEYGWKDAAAAVVTGVISGLSSVGIAANSVANGIVAGFLSYSSGANFKASVITGIVSGVSNAAGIGNLATKAGVKPGFKTGLVVDTVFGAGYSCTATATNKVIVANNQRKTVSTKKEVAKTKKTTVKKTTTQKKTTKKKTNPVKKFFGSVVSKIKNFFKR